jgi:hypothetical protein
VKQPEWTDEFLKLQGKLDKSKYGEWVFANKKASKKYSNLKLEFIYKVQIDNSDFYEYKAETENEFVLIRSFHNYVSIAKTDTENELIHNVDVVGALNENKEINIFEIMYYLEWSKMDEFEYYEFQ